MAVVPDLLASWRDPRGLIGRKLARPSEPMALATLMGACLMAFVAEWPILARQAQLDPSVPLPARIGGALMAVVFALPLLAYALAAVSHLIARALGGRGTGFGARMALFQALLATAPLMLLSGLVRGLIGPGAAATLVGLAWAGAFLWIWLSMLIASERVPSDV